MHLCWSAGIGANYINISPDFAEKHSKSHRQNPVKALEGRIRRVWLSQRLALETTPPATVPTFM